MVLNPTPAIAAPPRNSYYYQRENRKKTVTLLKENKTLKALPRPEMVWKDQILCDKLWAQISGAAYVNSFPRLLRTPVP